MPTPQPQHILASNKVHHLHNVLQVAQPSFFVSRQICTQLVPEILLRSCMELTNAFVKCVIIKTNQCLLVEPHKLILVDRAILVIIELVKSSFVARHVPVLPMQRLPNL